MSRRRWTREIGNPLSVFHGSAKGRDRKWSAFRIVVIGLWALFLWHFPTTWGPWDFAALAVLALAIPVADLFAAAPVKEGLEALTAIFGGVVARRMPTEIRGPEGQEGE